MIQAVGQVALIILVYHTLFMGCVMCLESVCMAVCSSSALSVWKQQSAMNNAVLHDVGLL